MAVDLVVPCSWFKQLSISGCLLKLNWPDRHFTPEIREVIALMASSREGLREQVQFA